MAPSGSRLKFEQGKRKKSSRKPVAKKKREPLATSFKCVFCSNETSVSVTIDRKNKIGHLSCKQCGQHFDSSSSMGSLMQPVDIYYEWIDACENVAKEQAAATSSAGPLPAHRQTQSINRSRVGLAPGEKYTDEDAGFIDDADADMDAEGEYADE
ncbi:hypothetical protein M433DRAFT_58037 [Acidomyces richmondensis BFW]|nr:MAG: hypothetical protein FE78DRAFT_30963 [Acidomyces sp. 'richmondensis']KYG49955.1 hypothetical protein M433DRAFT_58037 [Acidomyces richmondensis BFW]